MALWGYTAGPGGDPLFITIHFNNPYMFISWEEEPGATGYRVYRSTTPYDQFHLVQDGSINSYTTSMVGSDYFYYVTWY